MNLKLKTLVAAMAMVAGGTFMGAAQAALVNNDNSTVVGGGTGAGNLFLSVIDTVNRRSILLNTNITANQYRADPNSARLITNSALSQFLVDAGPGVNDPSAVRWNLGAISNLRPGEIGAQDVSNYGIFTTATNGGLIPSPDNSPAGNSALEGTINIVGGYLSAANTFDAAGTPQGPDLAVQDTVVVPAGNVAYHNGGAWAGTWGGNTTFTTEGAINGASLDFWFIHPDQTDVDFLPSIVEKQSGQWRLNFEAGNAALTYTATTAVPLPAAVWLLGSGLIGLIGVARRRV